MFLQKYRFGVESSARETATDISENEEANAIKDVMDRVLEAVSENKEYPYHCNVDPIVRFKEAKTSLLGKLFSFPKKMEYFLH